MSSQKGFVPILLLVRVLLISALILFIPIPYYQKDIVACAPCPPQGICSACPEPGWHLGSSFWQKLTQKPVSLSTTQVTKIPTPSAYSINTDQMMVDNLRAKFKPTNIDKCSYGEKKVYQFRDINLLDSPATIVDNNMKEIMECGGLVSPDEDNHECSQVKDCTQIYDSVTATWKNFESKKLNIGFKYPPNWLVSEEELGGLVSVNIVTDSGQSPMTFYDSTPPMGCENGLAERAMYKKITINVGAEKRTIDPFCTDLYLVDFKGTMIVVRFINENNENDGRQLLSSLRQLK